MPEPFGKPCDCPDCKAAVSPAAYLTALLDYALKHVRKSAKDKIDLPYLTNTFHQPFADLPTECNTMSQPVNQVRICIETLRSYLGTRPLADAAKETGLVKAEAGYRFAVYSVLLSRIGSSFEEIRRLRSADTDERSAAAERLGFDLSGPRPPEDPGTPGDELDQLFLDPEARPPSPHLLTEEAVEVLFGLANTQREPLSEGAKLGDDQAQITRWNLDGIAWGQNTDSEGRIHVSLLSTGAGAYRVELYRDPGRAELMAAGEITTAIGRVNLVAQNDSGLGGEIQLAFSAPAAGVSIAAVPAVLARRLAHLRTLWAAQDHPADPYGKGADPGLPFVDPDLIGPDDFRRPVAKAAGDPDRAFDLWIARRMWLDQKLATLRTDRETHGLDHVLRSSYGDPLSRLDDWSATLSQGGTDTEIRSVRDTLAAKGLSVEGFNRLMLLRAKDRLHVADSRNDPLSAAEWAEVDSILAQSAKIAEYANWQAQEQATSVRLGLEEFWFSTSEPSEGDWPPAQVAGQPLIDPGTVRQSELPDWLSGKQALSLWEKRKAELEKVSAGLKQTREAQGIEATLRQALGHPTPGDPLQYDIDTLKTDLSSPDDETRNQATQRIESGLHLSGDAFRRLLTIKAMDQHADPAKKPTAAQWAELYGLLTPASKTKHKYPQWAQQEQHDVLVYWQALKARLPRWRTSAESRQTWRQTLEARSLPPIIDPTVMGADDLRHIAAGDPAYDLWKSRYDQMSTAYAALKAIPIDGANTPTGFAQMVKDTLGFEVADLEAIDAERQAGRGIEKRLAQLNLAYGAFSYLGKILRLAQSPQPLITAAEWDTVYATLLRAKTQLASAALRADENDKGITLSPDLFKVPASLTTPLPYLDPSTPFWLSTRLTRSDWQDTLQSRIDQEIAAAQALQSALGAAEEATLPALRDALIAASDAAGTSPDERAEWATARLLVDAKSGSCRSTTRIAQSLETLQTLIFGLRTGQFKQLAPAPLSLVAEHFDEEWKWIGSYATFRAATFVFTYPENIAQPSLLKNKSEALENLIRNSRSARLTPDAACTEAETYSAYFHDMASLEIQATCQADTIVFEGEGCERVSLGPQSMFYMFAKAHSGKVYWSAYQADGSPGQGQTFWREIKGVGSIFDGRIIGAFPYRKKAGDPHEFGFAIETSYIHLFFLSGETGKQSLQLARLNLDVFGEWDPNITPLKSPPPPTNHLDILPVQTKSDSYPPALIFHPADGDNVYLRTLNADGTDWQPHANDWDGFLSRTGMVATQAWNSAVRWSSIVAAAKVNSDIWLVLRDPLGYFELALCDLPGEGGQITTGSSTFNIGQAGHQDIVGLIPGREPDDSEMAGATGSEIYLFIRDLTKGTAQYVHYRTVQGHTTYDPWLDAVSDLIRVAPHSGGGPDGQEMVAYQRKKHSWSYYMYRYRPSGSQLLGLAAVRAVIRLTTPLDVPLHPTAAALQKRRKEIEKVFADHDDAPPMIMAYLREAYFFVPLQLALALQAAGNYLPALDLFRTVYDYEAPLGPPNERNIYYGLEQDAILPLTAFYQQADGWLLDPLNPHQVASTRRYTYTRFTLMSLIRCQLEYADSQFAQETVEALATARTLYLAAIDLLNLPVLQQKLGTCDSLMAELRIEPGKDVPPEVPAAVTAIVEALTRWQRAGIDYPALIVDVKNALAGEAKWIEKLAQANLTVQTAIADTGVSVLVGGALQSQAALQAEKKAQLIQDAVLDQTLQDTSKGIAAGLVIKHKGIVLNGKPAPPPEPALPPAFAGPSLHFCIPPNPVLRALYAHAELNLYKLRNCRNIAGMKRQLDPYSAPTDTTSGLPSIGSGGQLSLPGTSVIRPSLYHERVLRDRAKELVQVAAQVEDAMLAALEKGAAQRYTLLKARHDLRLAQAGVRLQGLRVSRANHGVELAKLQRDRANIQATTYDEWIAAGLNQYEQVILQAYDEIADLQESISLDDASITALQAAATSATASTPWSATAAAAAAAAVSYQALSRSVSNLNMGRTQRDLQRASFWASYERRQNEWVLQQKLAQQDIKIGDQGIGLANDDVDIAEQEKAIAEMGANQAKDAVEFLNNQFTRTELYESMAATLESVYAFFLRNATAAAKMYENQVAFLRQEAPLGLIKGDYWAPPSDGGAGLGGQGSQMNQKGLTGSARLLQDLYQLDQYAFESKKRKLALTKIFSLASLAPAEFQRFRETGVMVFSTPMEMFDRDFPGHFLRLISRVSTSIIALVPALDGIHATLSNSGVSRVVIGPDVFQLVPIRKDPESVALTSPINATGVVDMDITQSDMLYPFEGCGVDGTWELRMPKAANQFDYRGIADVLVTMEFTALDSYDYRQQVLMSLKPTLSAERSFSFRRGPFADQWYDLNNPAQTDSPMTVRFITLREDFPPNLESVKIQNVLLYFVRSGSRPMEVPVAHLRYTSNDQAGTVGGGATTIDGAISTRRGNAGSWAAMIGKSPTGDWELALPDTEEMRGQFRDGKIEDIMLVIGYSGRTMPWPD